MSLTAPSIQHRLKVQPSSKTIPHLVNKGTFVDHTKELLIILQCHITRFFICKPVYKSVPKPRTISILSKPEPLLIGPTLADEDFLQMFIGAFDRLVTPHLGFLVLSQFCRFLFRILYCVLAFAHAESEGEWHGKRLRDMRWTYGWVCIGRRVIIRNIVSVFCAVCLRLAFIIFLKY